MEYYKYDNGIPARIRNPNALPELYMGNGNWETRNDPERWDMNAQEITEAEFNYLMASKK